MIVSHSPTWPRIVAEALREIVPPLAGSTRLHPSPAATVGAAVAACLDAPRVCGPPPAWLHPHQIVTWRRTVAAVNAHGGALIIESVGRGKTWIALAVAAEFHCTTTVIAPAILESQWNAASAAARVPIVFHSHERLSRGALPSGGGTVIIDEAHRFRNASTRRAIALAPWLVGRRAIACTATPIVNADTDLLAVLDLLFPDDVLALHGVRSLAAMVGAAFPPTALDRVVIRTARTEADWQREAGSLEPSALEDARAARGITAIDRLTLSRQPRVARLIRVTLLDALASSDAAFLGTLRRYGALLSHARDANGASRHVLRRYAGPDLEQTALWPLLDDQTDDLDLALDDVATVQDILRELRPQDQPWITAIQHLQLDEVPTICFSRHRATAAALRNALSGPVAWITGDAAGVGAVRLTRQQVLAAFGPGRRTWTLLRRIPTMLVATDVAAEGLDLQGAGRVLHVDVPWTAMRIAQREGRLTRIGQHHPSVAVLTRLPAARLEEQLAMHRRVQRKHACAQRWLDRLERDPVVAGSVPPAPAPTCLIRTRGAGVTVVAIEAGRGARLGTFVLCRRNGEWEVADSTLPSLLARAVASPLGYIRGSEGATLIVDALAAATRLVCDATPRHPDLVARIHGQASRARQKRDLPRLGELDQLLRFVGNRQNRGGRDLIRRVELESRLDLTGLAVPDQCSAERVQLRVVAALVFRSERGPLR